MQHVLMSHIMWFFPHSANYYNFAIIRSKKSKEIVSRKILFKTSMVFRFCIFVIKCGILWNAYDCQELVVFIYFHLIEFVHIEVTKVPLIATVARHGAILVWISPWIPKKNSTKNGFHSLLLYNCCKLYGSDERIY